ncbi:MAG: DNA-binding protein [Oscillospiraceae bacterium]|nr:DNA-binding protein [Oscillospiraceae bacterium]
MKQDNKDYIYLAWKDPALCKTYIVGKLSKNKNYVFEYIKGQHEKLENFEPLVAFPDVNKTYTNRNLFATFAARLPDKRRPEIKSILAEYNLKEYDEYELLKKSGAALPIDTFYFIDPILDIDEPFIERTFYINCGSTDCTMYDKLKAGDILDLEIEKANTLDSHAIKINFNDTFVGYVPDFFSREVSECIKKGRSIECKVIYLSPYKKHCREYVKVRLTIN